MFRRETLLRLFKTRSIKIVKLQTQTSMIQKKVLVVFGFKNLVVVQKCNKIVR